MKNFILLLITAMGLQSLIGTAAPVGICLHASSPEAPAEKIECFEFEKIERVGEDYRFFSRADKSVIVTAYRYRGMIPYKPGLAPTHPEFDKLLKLYEETARSSPSTRAYLNPKILVMRSQVAAVEKQAENVAKSLTITLADGSKLVGCTMTKIENGEVSVMHQDGLRRVKLTDLDVAEKEALNATSERWSTDSPSISSKDSSGTFAKIVFKNGRLAKNAKFKEVLDGNLVFLTSGGSVSIPADQFPGELTVLDKDILKNFSYVHKWLQDSTIEGKIRSDDLKFGLTSAEIEKNEFDKKEDLSSEIKTYEDWRDGNPIIYILVNDSVEFCDVGIIADRLENNEFQKALNITNGYYEDFLKISGIDPDINMHTLNKQEPGTEYGIKIKWINYDSYIFFVLNDAIGIYSTSIKTSTSPLITPAGKLSVITKKHFEEYYAPDLEELIKDVNLAVKGEIVKSKFVESIDNKSAITFNMINHFNENIQKSKNFSVRYEYEILTGKLVFHSLSDMLQKIYPPKSGSLKTVRVDNLGHLVDAWDTEENIKLTVFHNGAIFCRVVVDRSNRK
jgi:hypothetical protein